jgi:hypothetical protein
MIVNPLTGASITPPRVPLIDPRTGQIDRTWFLFFYNLFNGSVDNTDVVSGVLQNPTAPDAQAAIDAAVETIAQSPQPAELSLLESRVSALEQTPLPSDAPSHTLSPGPPATITVTSSPFTYQNTTTSPADVFVSGGTVSLLEFSRDGVVWYNTGFLYGPVLLSPSDRLRATYTAAPSMTLVPR